MQLYANLDVNLDQMIKLIIYISVNIITIIMINSAILVIYPFFIDNFPGLIFSKLVYIVSHTML
jgi:hypothetical protein